MAYPKTHPDLPTAPPFAASEAVAPDGVAAAICEAARPATVREIAGKADAESGHRPSSKRPRKSSSGSGSSGMSETSGDQPCPMPHQDRRHDERPNSAAGDPPGGRLHRSQANKFGRWPATEEEGLTSQDVVDLGLLLFSRDPIAIGWDGTGFVAMLDVKIGPYVLLSELLRDIGKLGR